MGDVKLLAMLAAWLGLRQTGLVLFLAVIVGALYGLGTILFRRRKTGTINSRGPATGSLRYHAQPGRAVQHLSRRADAGLVSASSSTRFLLVILTGTGIGATCSITDRNWVR